MNDYGVDWPLWSDEGLCADDVPELPPRLAAEVRAWAAHFNEIYSHEVGWPSEAASRENQRHGQRLQTLVQQELLTGDSVSFDHWEIGFVRGL